jgi:hypothetical protein
MIYYVKILNYNLQVKLPNKYKNLFYWDANIILNPYYINFILIYIKGLLILDMNIY